MLHKAVVMGLIIFKKIQKRLYGIFYIKAVGGETAGAMIIAAEFKYLWE